MPILFAILFQSILSGALAGFRFHLRSLSNKSQ